jgi:pimeloyl-ACP methyl ester carboxylesterase
VVRISDLTSQQIKLQDGRILGYAEYGTPDGKPIFYFHGDPSSRLEGWRLDEPAKNVKARIIAIDRPGMGLSDFKTGRGYLDWPDDVIGLAENLKIDRFAVLGLSGGGPYAVACAAKIPGRLTAVALVSSPCPFTVLAATKDFSQSQHISMFIVRRAFWLLRLRLSIFSFGTHRDPVGAMLRINGKIADIDREVIEKSVMRNPTALNRATANLHQAFRMGTRGVAWDYFLLMHSWGFHLEDISIPIQLWHGEADVTVPPSMGRYLSATIPNCQANFVSGEGHLMCMNHMQEILNDLVF